jgi:two-component system, NarL family, response regulator NreC
VSAAAIRVLLVDDHAVLRAGLRVLIDAQPDMQVVSEAGDGATAVTEARRTQPDVAVVDLTLPGMHGLQAIEAIRAALPRTRILVLTMHDDPEYVRPALAAGASAYLVKHVADTELISSIRAVHDGSTVVYLKAGRPALLPEERAGAGRGPAPLSARERDVLRLIASGHTQQEIARRLHIRPKTVETYRSRLSKKLGFSSRAELVRYALDTGVLSEGGTLA